MSAAPLRLDLRALLLGCLTEVLAGTASASLVFAALVLGLGEQPFRSFLDSPAALALEWGIASLAAAAGGYVAATVARSAPLAHAALVGLAWFGFGVAGAGLSTQVPALVLFALALHLGGPLAGGALGLRLRGGASAARL